MSEQQAETIRTAVRETYGAIARSGTTGCGCDCGPDTATKTAEDASRRLGYSEQELQAVPEGANLGLGCGNPQAIAALKPGETVLDLGSGGGFDCFLAARQVGAEGCVIGVDMTPDMLTRARENAIKVGLDNVEFRLGEIERLPVADSTVDVIISNCVINLSPDKPAVFREAFRVLKPGGRLAVKDVVARTELPEEVRSDLELHSACVSGAEPIDRLTAILTEIGFVDIRIGGADETRDLIREWVPGSKVEDFVLSASIEATRP